MPRKIFCDVLLLSTINEHSTCLAIVERIVFNLFTLTSISILRLVGLTNQNSSNRPNNFDQQILHFLLILPALEVLEVLILCSTYLQNWFMGDWRRLHSIIVQSELLQEFSDHQKRIPTNFWPRQLDCILEFICLYLSRHKKSFCLLHYTVTQLPVSISPQ